MEPVSIAAIGWGFAAAGWLITPYLTRFLNKCFDALGVDPRFQSRRQILLEKLEDLQTTLLPQLLILTDAAQHSPHRQFLNKWLQDLKSNFYEAEHVLSLIEYQRLKKEVNSLFPSTSKSISKKLKDKLLKFSSEENDLRNVLIKSLENLEANVNKAMEIVPPIINLPSSSGNNSTLNSNEHYSETTSTPGSKVIGRDRDRDLIVNLLRENISESTSDDECYSVIGIWGMGGSGKTTLAQYVCEHEKKDKYFDCVLWAHVSEKFSVRAVLEKILESASKKPCPDYSSLEGLCSKLEEELRGKMFFLVLDNFWFDKGVSEQELKKLFVPLRYGERGSKILVTTRNEEAARALGAMDLMILPELADEDFLSLFMSHALKGIKVNEHVEKKLRAIGKENVGKLCRLPLAAEIVAGPLRRDPNPDVWSSILNRSLLNNTMGALLLSYQHLPPALQRCFAFCSLFPKGHLYEHDHVINLWIAEGLIETEDSNEHMKDIANRYIVDLISSSFFQIVEWGSKVYSMHDLMHDLAHYVSGGEHFRIESGEKKEIPAHTRHIFVVDHMFGEYVDKICKIKDLRTIIISQSYSDVILEEKDLNALFTELQKLYVVEIEPDVIGVPQSVVNLRNLRYFKLDTVDERDSPFISPNKLYQLRFLSIDSEIPDVGRLTLLQELEEFHVKMESETSEFQLKQLEHLKDLYGSLSIYGLDNVESKEEADQAKLSEKRGLHKLQFSWDYESRDVIRDIDVQILDGLRPPPQIKELSIEGYTGKSFPSWILENNDNIIHLRDLELTNCVGLESLHRINELLDLHYLEIYFLPRLKNWEPLPLNLTQLDISHCFSLAFANKEDLEMIMSTKGTQTSQIMAFKENSPFKYNHFKVDFQFRRIREMMKLSDHSTISIEQIRSTISNNLKKCLEKRLDLIFQLEDVCDKLSLPVALQKLSIETCFITDKVLAGSLHGLTSLTHLSLQDIIMITCIPKEVLSSLTNLLNLCINGCLLLRSIGGWDTHSTLAEFYIKCCPNLIFETTLSWRKIFYTLWLGHPSVLKSFTLHGCMPLDDMLQGLVSLEDLHVVDCPSPNIVNLHIGHLKKLSLLELVYCPNLVSLRGLSKLSNLKRLKVMSGCKKLKCYSDSDKLPQLKELCITRWSLLEQLVSRDGLSSLVSLELLSAQQDSFKPEECVVFGHLSSLREINFSSCKMHSLPDLHCLHSLRFLKIKGCKNLSSLPQLPQSVEDIVIIDCGEEFTRSCRDLNHPNQRKIHISYESIE